MGAGELGSEWQVHQWDLSVLIKCRLNWSWQRLNDHEIGRSSAFMVARVRVWRFSKGDVVSANEDYLRACVWKIWVAGFLLKWGCVLEFCQWLRNVVIEMLAYHFGAFVSSRKKVTCTAEKSNEQIERDRCLARDQANYCLWSPRLSISSDWNWNEYVIWSFVPSDPLHWCFGTLQINRD